MGFSWRNERAHVRIDARCNNDFPSAAVHAGLAGSRAASAPTHGHMGPYCDAKSRRSIAGLCGDSGLGRAGRGWDKRSSRPTKPFDEAQICVSGSQSHIQDCAFRTTTTSSSNIYHIRGACIAESPVSSQQKQRYADVAFSASASATNLYQAACSSSTAQQGFCEGTPSRCVG